MKYTLGYEFKRVNLINNKGLFPSLSVRSITDVILEYMPLSVENEKYNPVSFCRLIQTRSNFFPLVKAHHLFTYSCNFLDKKSCSHLRQKNQPTRQTLTTTLHSFSLHYQSIVWHRNIGKFATVKHLSVNNTTLYCRRYSGRQYIQKLNPVQPRRKRCQSSAIFPFIRLAT